MADNFDPLDDLLGVEPVKNARALGKFRPKPKLRPQKKATEKSSAASTQAIQTVHSTPHVLSEPIEIGKSLESNVVPDQNDKADLRDSVGMSVEENDNVLSGSEAIADSLPLSNTDAVGTQVSSSIDVSTNIFKADVPKDPSPSVDLLVSNIDLPNDKDNCQGIEEMVVMDSINMAELITRSGQNTNSVGLQSSTIQHDSSEKDLSPSSQHDDVVDLSSLEFTHTLPTESTSELHLSEESMNLLEEPQLDSCTHMEGLPEIPAKLASRRAKTGNSKNNGTPDPHPEQQNASTSSKENEAGRSLRPRNGKTSIRGLVDDDGDEIIATGEFSEEQHFNFAINEETINTEHSQVECESKKKNLKRKSKKTDNDKEKPPRKSKKAKEPADQDTHAKQKKFSHSTRRRRVDKNLLNIPDDEFDPREVPLRDLILLAEHKEKLMKTDNSAAGVLETLRSTGNSRGFHNDEASNYGQDEDDDDRIPVADDTTEYFNYHFRMDRTPRVRWSKQDTELFYEGVKQFGTDFSVIAQLFPGRTREQIRNKYKKEERQKPLMLREALTTRSKDHSYFEKVIGDLKQMRAKEEKEDLEDSSYQEEASIPDDDGANHDYAEEEENVGVANDSTEAQSYRVMEEQKKQEEQEEQKKQEEEVEVEEDEEPWNNLKWDM